MDEFIRYEDRVPESGERCLVVTVHGELALARYFVPTGRYVYPHWQAEEEPFFLFASDAVIHWKLVGDLPPLPRPRGPFSRNYKSEVVSDEGLLGWWQIWHGDDKIDLRAHRGAYVLRLVDWLNEMWAKAKLVGLKHRAQPKIEDPVIANRWAMGYYVQVEGRHFIVLEDAELFEHYLDEALSGFVEIRPETLEAVE